jgi:quercetin dioxygenase-like cupin family protein
MHILKTHAAALVMSMLCLAGVRLSAQEPKVTPLMTKVPNDIPGKEVLMLTVDYAPGVADAVHRHNAYGFVYVLQGSVVEQVRGQKPVTLSAGQTFYEGPEDVHVVGRNASRTKPAKILVVLLKNKGAPAVLPVD